MKLRPIIDVGFLIALSFIAYDLRQLRHDNIASYSQNETLTRRGMTNTNMITRVYHYIRHHDPLDPELFCPECHEILRNEGEARYNRMVEEGDEESPIRIGPNPLDIEVKIGQ